MRIEDVIGQQITRRREQIGLTQAQVGHELGLYLGKLWPRQAVSAAEKGRRAFTAAELVAFAVVLNVRVRDLMALPPGVSEIKLGDGGSIEIVDDGQPGGEPREDLERLEKVLGDLRGQVAELQDQVDGVNTQVRRVRQAVKRSVNELWLVSHGDAIDPADVSKP